MLSALLIINYKVKKVILEKRSMAKNSLPSFDPATSTPLVSKEGSSQTQHKSSSFMPKTKWTKFVLQKVFKKPYVLQYQKKYKILPLTQDLKLCYVSHGKVMYIAIGRVKKINDLQLMQYLSSFVQNVKRIANNVPKDESPIMKNYTKILLAMDEFLFGMNSNVVSVQSEKEIFLSSEKS